MGRENTFPILTKVWGADAMYHVVNGVPFRTNPNVFFQVNTHQAGKLVDMVFNAAGKGGPPSAPVLYRIYKF